MGNGPRLGMDDLACCGAACSETDIQRDIKPEKTIAALIFGNDRSTMVPH
jgi:hypothetical protein